MRLARLCLALLVFLIPLIGGQPGVAPLAIAAVLVSSGWLAWATERTAARPARFPLAWPLAALLVITLLTTVTSVYRPASVLAVWQVLVLTGMAGLACVVSLDRRQIGIGAWLFLAGMQGGLGYAWWGWITAHDPNFRITSTWINTNYYAAFLLISLPLLAALARRLASRWRWVFCVIAVLSLASLFMTQSRGAVLALLVMLLVFVPAWAWLEGRLSARTIGLAAIGFVILIGLALASPLGKRILDPQVRAHQMHSQLFRVYTWHDAFRMANAHPLLGTGPNTFASAYGQYQTMGYTRNPHSLYLQAAAETGWPGLAVLLFLLGSIGLLAWSILKATARSSDETDRLPAMLALALLAAVMGLLLHGFVDAIWALPGIQMLIVLHTVVVWRLVEQPKLNKAPMSTRIAVPAVLLAIAFMMIPGAYAERYADEARHAEKVTNDWRATQLRQALAMSPTNASYLRDASAYTPAEEGLQYLRRAMALEPTNAANWLYLGHLHLRAKQYAEAKQAYATAVEKQAHFFPALFGLAETDWRLGNNAECRKTLRQIVDMEESDFQRTQPVDVPEPWYLQSWYALAVLDARDGQDAAEQDFRRAVTAGERYDQSFAAEAAAWSEFTNSQDEQLRVHMLTYLACLRLHDTDGAQRLREKYFNRVPDDFFNSLPKTPFL